MGRSVYVPFDDKIWFDYFLAQAKQTGHGINGFEGLPYQRGNGLGSFFGRLFRSILPVAKKVGKSALKTVGKEALKFTGNVIGDVAEGENIKKSIQRRGKQSGQDVLKKASAALVKQSGGRPVKRAVESNVCPVPAKKRRGRPKKKNNIENE